MGRREEQGEAGRARPPSEDCGALHASSVHDGPDVIHAVSRSGAWEIRSDMPTPRLSNVSTHIVEKRCRKRVPRLLQYTSR